MKRMQELTSAPSAALWQPRRHISQLDGVRGLAILAVTLYRFSKEIPTDSWLGQTLYMFFGLGDRGVDLFFVLSGFLITGILVDTKGSKHYFINFLARRSLRIFPLYFAALFLLLIIGNWFPAFSGKFALADKNQFYLWTYLANFKMSVDGVWCFGYLDHFWSLAVEEHFYLVWPLALFVCSRGTALKLAAVTAVVCAGARVCFAAVSDNGVAPDVFTLFRCDALLIGAMLALQIRSAQGLAPLRRWAVFCFPVCLMLGLAAELLDKRLFTIAHTLWPLLWACVLVWLLSGHDQHWLARLFNLSGLRLLGTLSYAMYVFQSPLIPIVGSVCSVTVFMHVTGNEIVSNLIYMALMFAFSYAAALLSWYGLEQHCLKLKKWFPSDEKLQPSAPVVLPSRPSDVSPLCTNPTIAVN